MYIYIYVYIYMYEYEHVDLAVDIPYIYTHTHIGTTRCSRRCTTWPGSDLTEVKDAFAGLGFVVLKVQGLGFRVWGLGFRVWGLAFWGYCLGFRVLVLKLQGLGCRGVSCEGSGSRLWMFEAFGFLTWRCLRFRVYGVDRLVSLVGSGGLEDFAISMVCKKSVVPPGREFRSIPHRIAPKP